jgi:ABC-type sugar transport system substrate-binding protein
LVSVGLAAAACGGSSTSSTAKATPTSGASTGATAGAGLDQYQQLYEQGQAAVTWAGPSEPAKAPANKSVTVVTCTQALEGCKLLTAGAVNAAKAIGWSTRVIDVTDPTKYDQALQTAIAQGANAIVLTGVDQRLVPGGLKAAKSKKVPVVSLFQNNVPGPNGVDVEVEPDPVVEGKLLAASMIVDHQGKVNVLFMPDQEFSLPVAVLKTVKSELQACSACTVKFAPEINFTAATIGTTLPGRVVAALRNDPSINSLLVGFDPPVTQVIPALNAAGLGSKVKFYSQLGTTAALSFIADGNVMSADVGASNEWGGWGAIDEVVRLLNGQPTVDEKVPAVLLTKKNVPAKGQPFVGLEAGFKDKYLALWK